MEELTNDQNFLWIRTFFLKSHSTTVTIEKERERDLGRTKLNVRLCSGVCEPSSYATVRSVI